MPTTWLNIESTLEISQVDKLITGIIVVFPVLFPKPIKMQNDSLDKIYKEVELRNKKDNSFMHDYAGKLLSNRGTSDKLITAA